MYETETNVGEPVIELALCESERLVLKPDVLYRFWVSDACDRCKALERIGKLPKPNREPRDGRDVL